MRRDLKMGSDVNIWMSCGSAFQSLGAERLKDLSPMVDRRAGGVERREAEEDRSVWEGVYISRSSVGYGGARLWRALNVRSRLSKSIQKRTGSQWSCLRMGVMFCVDGVLDQLKFMEGFVR